MGKKLVIHSFLSKVLATASGVVLVILSSRWLGAEIRGEITLLLTWAGAWVMLSDFVTGSALINLSAKFNTKSLWGIAFKWLVLIVCIASLFHFFIPSKQSEIFWIVPILLLFMGLYNTQGALLIGKGKLNARNYSFSAISVLNLIGFSFLALSYGPQELNALDYFICLISAWFLCWIFTYFKISQFFKEKVQEKEGLSLTKTVFKTGAKSQTGHLIQYAAARLPFMLMPFLFGKEQLGVYGNAVVLGEGVLIIAASLGQILHAKLIHYNNLKEGVEETIRYTRLSFLLILPATVLVAILPNTFWVWLLNEEFVTLGTLFLFYSPVLLFQSVSSIISHAYHAGGRFEMLIKANAVGLSVGLSALLFLSSVFGLQGFILGIVLGYFAQFIFLLASFIAEFKQSPLSFIPNLTTLKEIKALFKKH